MINEESVNTVRALIALNEYMTVAEIEQYLQDVTCNPLLHGTVVEVRVRISMSKLRARWDPKLLDD